MNKRIIEQYCEVLIEYLNSIESKTEDIEDKFNDLKDDLENDNVNIDDFDLDEILNIKSDIDCARSYLQAIFENIYWDYYLI